MDANWTKSVDQSTDAATGRFEANLVVDQLLLISNDAAAGGKDLLFTFETWGGNPDESFRIVAGEQIRGPFDLRTARVTVETADGSLTAVPFRILGLRSKAADLTPRVKPAGAPGPVASPPAISPPAQGGLSGLSGGSGGGAGTGTGGGTTGPGGGSGSSTGFL